MSDPLVSVVLQSYNHAQFVRESLESVLGQTYQRTELIVVDDGSDDESPQIIEAYARRYPGRMTVLSRRENWGVSRTHNQTLDLITGTILTRVASDDVLRPDALEKQVEYFQAHPNIDILATDFDVIDAAGAIHSGDAKLEVCPQFRRYFETGLDDLYDALMQGNFLPDAAITVSLARIKKNELSYDERCPSLSDWDLWLRLARSYRWAYLPEAIVQYRWHGANLSSPGRSPEQVVAVNAERIYVLAKTLTAEQTPERRQVLLERIVTAVIDAPQRHELPDTRVESNRAWREAQDAVLHERSLTVEGLRSELENVRRELHERNLTIEGLRVEAESLRRELAWREYRRMYPNVIAASTAASHNGRQRLDDDRNVIAGSELFDGEWYLSQNPDVAASGIDPAWHFLRHGGGEGRDPGPDFDSRAYVLEHPDVSASGINSLLHYEQARQVEPRTIEDSGAPGSAPLRDNPDDDEGPWRRWRRVRSR